MAEIEIFDLIESTEKGVQDEVDAASSELGSAEKEQFMEEIEAVKKNVKKLADVAETFRNLTSGAGTALKSLFKFVMHNAAIALIFNVVSLGLSKTIKKCTDKKEQEPNMKKLAVVKAIADLTESENTLCTDFQNWLNQHKDESICLEGIKLPLESILESRLDPMVNAVKKAYAATSELKVKNGNRTSYKVPSKDDIEKLIDASDSFVDIFQNLIDFAGKEVKKVPNLQSLLVVLNIKTVEMLRQKLQDIKKLCRK